MNALPFLVASLPHDLPLLGAVGRGRRRKSCPQGMTRDACHPRLDLVRGHPLRLATTRYCSLDNSCDRSIPKGSDFARSQAHGVLRVARLLWEFFINEELATDNPFKRVRLSSLPARSTLWVRSQVESFIRQADELQYGGIGTAALLAFELCQRQGDVLAADSGASRPPIPI